MKHHRAWTFAWLLVCPWVAFGIAWWYVRSITARFVAEPSHDLPLLALVVVGGIVIWSLAYGLHRTTATIYTQR